VITINSWEIIKLEKDPLYNFQTGLQYVFNPTYSASAGYFYTVGGESTVNGQDMGDINKIHRYQLTGQGNLCVWSSNMCSMVLNLQMKIAILKIIGLVQDTAFRF
jgi:hypothetical protein